MSNESCVSRKSMDYAWSGGCMKGQASKRGKTSFHDSDTTSGAVQDDTVMGFSLASQTKSPGRPTSLQVDKNKRPRADLPNNGKRLSLAARRKYSPVSNLLLNSADNLEETIWEEVLVDKNITCNLALLDVQMLHEFLNKEMYYHPNNAFLYYVNPDIEEKVDVHLRNKAVYGLRYLHNKYFNLSMETFYKAVNLIDRFIIKVKVKPKYMSCVTVTSYYIAATLCEPNEAKIPAPDQLVQISRCGGNVCDFHRMKDILCAKLNNDIDGVTVVDFLKLFEAALTIRTGPDDRMTTESEAGGRMHGTGGSSSGASPASYESDLSEDTLYLSEEELEQQQRRTTASSSTAAGPRSSEPSGETASLCPSSAEQSLRVALAFRQSWAMVLAKLQVAMCRLEVYQFKAPVLALATLYLAGVTGLNYLIELTGVDMGSVYDCAKLITDLHDAFVRDVVPQSRRSGNNVNSRRCSSPTPLDTISEVNEPTDEDVILNF